MKILTKSLYMSGQQCPKLLWHAERKLLPEPSLSDKHKFKQGRLFEEQVKKLFPKTSDLQYVKHEENIEKTKELIKNKKTIFEAGFQFENLFVKADLLEPNGDGWNLTEIKATTKVKPQHYPDLAFQKYVCEKNGLKINKCFVIHLNKEYTKKGDIIPKELIAKEDVTEKVNKVKDIEKHAEEYLEFIKEKQFPKIPIGSHCNKPYPCSLKSICWSYLPEKNLLQLTTWRLYWKLFKEGIVDMKDLPKGTELNPKDQRIYDASMKDKPTICMGEIKTFLDSLNYPLYHFDFETFQTAVPLFDKSIPYQKIPFQYSLHIQQKDGSVEHHEFLGEVDKDPRIALLQALKTVIDTSGDIIVYHQSFEITVLKELAKDFPEHSEWINNMLDRIVDLEKPFKDFYYYNALQKGSSSLKKVLPALTGKGYDDLEINNGMDASMKYFYSHIEHEIEDKDLRKYLLQYCCLDTEAMVWIVNELKKVIQ
jgi:hypothetical protein